MGAEQGQLSSGSENAFVLMGESSLELLSAAAVAILERTKELLHLEREKDTKFFRRAEGKIGHPRALLSKGHDAFEDTFLDLTDSFILRPQQSKKHLIHWLFPTIARKLTYG